MWGFEASKVRAGFRDSFWRRFMVIVVICRGSTRSWRCDCSLILLKDRLRGGSDSDRSGLLALGFDLGYEASNSVRMVHSRFRIGEIEIEEVVGIVCPNGIGS